MMNVGRAMNKIINTIKTNQKLDSISDYKIVIDGPNAICNQSGFGGVDGYKVLIGKRIYIDVPLEMLEHLLERIRGTNGLYNREIFRRSYPNLLRNKPCYVHVIGGIFVKAHIATKTDNRNYILS